jgi:ribulose-5-phosphate 4-epimerase/fuculose-1-phosphate aldolase
MEEFAELCRRAAVAGLMQCSSGNMSQRIDANRVLVSASRSWMSGLTADDVVLCRLADGVVLNDRKPSVETRFHLGILRERPEARVVLHFQSPFATVLSCCDAPAIDFAVIPEVPYYIGTPAVVPYITPGSPELAEAVIEAMTDHDLAILQNHGQVTLGRNFEEALQKAVFFELACRVLVQGGDGVIHLTHEAFDVLRSHAEGRRPRGV